jgi:hypothetical protein
VREHPIFFSFEADESLLPETFRYVGENHFVYATDIPHWDCDSRPICAIRRSARISPTRLKTSSSPKMPKHCTQSSDDRIRELKSSPASSAPQEHIAVLLRQRRSQERFIARNPRQLSDSGTSAIPGIFARETNTAKDSFVG